MELGRNGCWPRLALACLLFAAAPAAAQRKAEAGNRGEQGKGSPEYLRTVGEAIAEYRLGNWSEAEALFRRAHELNPNARTLRGMGLAAYENRNYVRALKLLREALEDKRQALSESQRTEVRETIERASRFVARYELSLEPDFATLQVSGNPATLEPSGELWLDPGTYEIVAQAEGYKAARSQVNAASGARGNLEFKLQPLGAPEADATGGTEPTPLAEPPNQRSAVTRDDSWSTGESAMIFGGFGIALLGVVAGTTTGIMTLSNAGELEKVCNDGTCPEDQTSRLDESNTLAIVSNVSFGVAAAGAVVGVIGLVLALKGDAEAEPTPASTVRLDVGPGRAAIVLQGSL